MTAPATYRMKSSLLSSLLLFMLVVAKMFLNKFKHSMIVKNSKTELAKKEAVHSGTDS